MTTVPDSPAPYETGTGQLLLSVAGGIARITLNNPERRNALSVEMRSALPAMLATLTDDPDVRVIVLTGAGERAFSAGADVSEFDRRPTPDPARGQDDRGSVIGGPAGSACTKPIIAMIRGYCIGGGLLLALQADIRLAAAGSEFGIPAGKLGVGYRMAAVAALLDVVGPAWTSEILFSARRLSAEEAVQIGLVNRAVAAERLEDEVTELARMIAENAPLTIAACKAAITELRREPAERDVERVEQMMAACYRSEDYREGQRAFREKRAPRFIGR
jgi:enoyl-CoA hydratase/carnithine racemase